MKYATNNRAVLNLIAYSSSIHIWYGYQEHCRVYLDEYKEQKEIRREHFAIRRNLENDALKKMS